LTEDEVYQQLTQIFRDVFMRDDMTLHADLTARDVPGWDSFKQIEIIIAVEEAYNFKFRTREIDSLHNVGDLVRTVLTKTA